MDDGRVKILNGMIFKPFMIVPYAIGQKMQAEIDVASKKYNIELNALDLKFHERLVDIMVVSNMTNKLKKLSGG